MSNKIAYCFLVYDKIVRHDIWNKFFQDKDTEEYEVIIHSKYNLSKEYLDEIYKFKYKQIEQDESVKTFSKNDINIVRATLLLLKKALEYENVSHILFLSQSCIPLHKYDILKNIIGKIDRSIIDCKLNKSVERYRTLTKILQNTFNVKYFYKQQPNMLLIRHDAKLFVDNDLTNEWSRVLCPDEHYFINNGLHIFEMNILRAQINFCNLIPGRTQALTFNNVNTDFLNKLRGLGYLFMRKIEINSVVDDSYLID